MYTMQKQELVDEILSEMDIRREVEEGFFMDETEYSRRRSELMEMSMEELKNVAKKYYIDA